MIGRSIGHFEILEKIGEGGMGTVYKARDTDLGRLVALKVLRSGLLASEDHRRRVRNEARAASVLNHPNIVTIYEIARVDDLDCIVMEYIDGRPLSELIPAGGMPLETVLKHAVPIASALAAAHQAGIVHRDLKPQNVLVTNAGVPKIVDFGLAKLAADAVRPIAAEDATLTSPVQMEWTDQRVIAGTAAYMSPEQVEGKSLDARSDVFSFGIMLYEMARGKRPFGGDTAIAMMGAILHTTPETAELPTGLRAVVERALKKDPDARQTSGKALFEELASIGRTASRRGWLAPVAAILALTLIAAGFVLYRASQARKGREQVGELVRLQQEGKALAAFDLLERVSRVVPDDARLPALRADIARDVAIETNPSGAEVWYQDYTVPDSVWRLLGVSPLKASAPYVMLRWKFVKPGFETAYEAPYNSGGQLNATLLPLNSTPPEMVNVPTAIFNLAAGGLAPEQRGRPRCRAEWV